MVRLSRAVVEALVIEFGRDEVLRRLADPFWFQAFGCILGFDWHSSGLTTTVMGALKEALAGAEGELGLVVAGGKGRVSRRTPAEIVQAADRLGFEPEPIVYASRMSAKVDTAALQDGYQIYHHTIVFTPDGKWAVVQQGMNERTGFARRYHWLSEGVRSFVEEPHSGIASQRVGIALDMTARASAGARACSVELANEPPQRIVAELVKAKRILEGRPTLFDLPQRRLVMPRRHFISLSDISPQRLERIFLRTYERAPQSYEELLGMRGVGPAAVRALALLSELLYGKPPSFEDPARFSFAHGGKDGHPYPVDRRTYDFTIETLRRAIERARLEARQKDRLLFKLDELFGVGA